ncbi:MAG: transcriptional regulator [Chloroflexaceae bacterium]|nr:transcriptional regulator [Chloroflexaceae bacterium]
MNMSVSAQQLLKTRFSPPPRQAHLLPRARLTTLLARIADYPLTMLVAPAGSGKTIALADLLTQLGKPAAWCRMAEDDTPLSLVQHLAAACQWLVTGQDQPTLLLPTAHSLPDYVMSGSTPDAILDNVLNTLATGLRRDALLILDDYHEADEHPALRSIIERFLDAQPRTLHVVLATRYSPTLRMFPVLRARGEVFQVTQTHLALTASETRDLFALYDHPLIRYEQGAADLANLTAYCRGLPLALQLLASNRTMYVATATARTDHTEQAILDAVSDGLSPAVLPPTVRSSLNHLMALLDEYFQREVLNVQPEPVREFLLHTAALRWIDLEACRNLLNLPDAQRWYSEVERRDIFLEPTSEEMPGQMNYQPLFHSFLRRQASRFLPSYHDTHARAARYYQQREMYNEALYHLFAVSAMAQAADLLAQVTGAWLQQGRSGQVLSWIMRLPESYRHMPALLEARAAATRQQGHFEQALRLYREAESAARQHGDVDLQVRVLRGQAEVYLDTVQPAPAVELLDRALTLLSEDRYTERIELLLLQAENWANLGRADVALELESRARHLAQVAQENGVAFEAIPSLVPMLLPRLLLRSGRLHESLRQLEAGLTESAGVPEQQPAILAHREPSLLLAFVYSLLGKDARALATARRGLLEAQQSGTTFTEAIAHIRVGHAYQIITPLDAVAARRHYQQALEMIQTSGVRRTRVEALMGMILLHGHSGDLGNAEATASEALEILEQAGDEWITALVWLALGSAAVASFDSRAPTWLAHAQERFSKGRDSYGQAVVALWQALWYLHQGDIEQLDAAVGVLLELAHQHGYEGLLTANTLFGPRDLAMLIPLLLRGEQLPQHVTYAHQLLRQAFPSVAGDDMVDDYHPGYTLRVQMLGSFRVWRGMHEVQGREWQREKARQLLQLLLTYRGQWLQREQICLWLWPDSDLDAAERQFKVTLNALNAALEPIRPPRTMPFFVRRQGLAYSFAPSYGCWIDVDEFELRTTNVFQGDEHFLMRNRQIAVTLYRGDYLAESLYDSWTLEERERLLARFLATTTMLADQLARRGEVQQAIELCELVLRRDRCYEEAYQVLMRAYVQSGSRSQALRTYARCEQALNDELGIEPLPETTELFERIKRNEKI